MARNVCVLAAVLIPVLANGLRVYLTILASHLTNMRFGPGEEHITFGRIFFLVVIFAMLWIGRRWHDDMPSGVKPRANAMFPSTGDWKTWWPLPVALGAAVIGMGLVFVMWWLIILGVVLTVVATAGMLFEYYAGEFARE